jgi:hypothetical protein
MKLSIVAITSDKDSSTISVLRETRESIGLKLAQRVEHLLDRVKFTGRADWDALTSVIVNNAYKGTGKAQSAEDLLNTWQEQIENKEEMFSALTECIGSSYSPELKELLIEELLEANNGKQNLVYAKLFGCLPLVTTNGAQFLVACPITGGKDNVIAQGYSVSRISYGQEYTLEAAMNDLYYAVDRSAEKEKGTRSIDAIETAKRMELSLRGLDYTGQASKEITLIDIFGEASCKEAESRIADVIKTQSMEVSVQPKQKAKAFATAASAGITLGETI